MMASDNIETAADRLFGDSMNTTKDIAEGKTASKVEPQEDYVPITDRADPHESNKEALERVSQEKRTAPPSEDHVQDVSQMVQDKGYEHSEVTTEFAEFTHKNKLDAKEAEELVSMYEKQKLADEQAMQRKFRNQVDGWKEQSLSEFDETDIEEANYILNEFGNEELKQIINSTGFGNHPALVRFCVKLAKHYR